MDTETEKTATEIVDAAIKVHRALGPGLLESVYENCLRHELRRRGVEHRSQCVLPIVYEGTRMEAGLRVDLIANSRVIIELKAVETMLPLHSAQLLTYLKLSGLRLGFLINFNVPLMRDGIKRLAL